MGSVLRDFPSLSNSKLSLEGYPLYQRNNSGVSVNARSHDLDNSYVVPHSPYLLQKYDCHINVEACVSIKSVKYLYNTSIKDMMMPTYSCSR